MLDESSFQQLLAAAYVVQQHNDNLWAKIPQLDTAMVLSEIAEMQAMAQTGKLDLSVAGKLITERLLMMVGATGVSLSLVNDGYLDCVAESGVPAKVSGSSLASHSLVATERLKAGEVFESADARADIRLDFTMCNGLGVGSLVAAPVIRFGLPAGLIEVRWARPRAFDETGLFACRLMASLVEGMLERIAPPPERVSANTPETKAPEKSAAVSEARAEAVAVAPVPAAFFATEVATEPGGDTSETPVKTVAPATTSIEAGVSQAVPISTVDLESHISEISAPVSDIPRADAASREVSKPIAAHAAHPATADVVEAVLPSCRVCGRPFGADEAFCGYCSMPRVAANQSDELQSKWASLWFLKKAQGALTEGNEEFAPEIAAPDVADTSVLADTPSAASASVETVAPAQFSSAQFSSKEQGTAPRAAEVKDHFSYFEPVSFEQDAASETEFWERAAAVADASKSFIQKLRLKDVALVVVALALAIGVVSAWPSSTGKLTWFGSIVVRMGLARHSVPAYAGNPAVNVWMDEQTSRYYCPGEDTHGRTSVGHFASQLEAEEAQFQPASGLVCQ